MYMNQTHSRAHLQTKIASVYIIHVLVYNTPLLKSLSKWVLQHGMCLQNGVLL